MKLTTAELHFIEKSARMFQFSGNTLSEGKIIAFLLICEKGLVPFDEIMETLQLSKGNTSQSLKSLTAKGLIEKGIIPFERKSYFQLTNPNQVGLLENRIQSIAATRSIFNEAQNINKQFKRKKQQGIINDFIAFNDFIYDEMVKIREKWSKR